MLRRRASPDRFRQPHQARLLQDPEMVRREIDARLLDVLGSVKGRDEFARRLLATGPVDRSDGPLPEARS